MKNIHSLSACTIILVAFGTISFSGSNGKGAMKKLEEAAASIPRGITRIPQQWFEMETILGWEKMMLILGYADNKSICAHLKEIAQKESPMRKFRCTPSN